MAVVPNRRPQKYGGLLVDREGRVTGFVGRGSDQVSYHFFGVQVAETEAFERVSPDVPSESVRSLYPALIHERLGSVMALSSDASWLDIGTPADYLATCVAIAAREGQPLAPGSGASISPSTTIERSVLWDDVTTGAAVHLSRAIVCDGVHLEAGTAWHDVTIRVAGIDLAPGERRVGHLAVASLAEPDSPPIPA
jgi:NDP-sugar pyrophosphorylase family protein